MTKFLKDAESLISELESVHPNLFFRCARKDYLAGKRRFLAGASAAGGSTDFTTAAKKFLHVIHDGHTSVSVPAGDGCARLPFDCALVERRLFVVKVYDESCGIKEKSEILSVDGRPGFKYLKGMTELMSYELKARALRSAAAGFPRASAHPAGKPPVSISVRTPAGARATVALDWGRYKTGLPRPGHLPFSFKYIEGIKAGCLEWNQFVDRRTYDFYCAHGIVKKNAVERRRFPCWETFLSRMFGELRSRRARGLIVDLRENSGGNSALGDNLIEYLTGRPVRKFSGYARLSPLLLARYGDKYGKLAEKFSMGSRISREIIEKELGGDPVEKLFALKKSPAQKFGGKVILLTGPGTYSAAETFAAAIKDNSLGMLIGEPAGNGSNGPIDSLSFVLPRSRLSINISFYFRLRPDLKKRRTLSLKPDLYSKQTVKDFLCGRDTVLELAKKKQLKTALGG